LLCDEAKKMTTEQKKKENRTEKLQSHSTHHHDDIAIFHILYKPVTTTDIFIKQTTTPTTIETNKHGQT
jgi:hypothetical protein